MTGMLSTVLGISFAAGLNAYATVLALGVLDRLGILDLPSSLEIVSTTPVMAIAALMYAVEFVADKVPWIDTVWDTIHTVIRPAAGGLLAYGVVGDVDPQWQVVAALAGGSMALTSHAAKASTRAAVNVSPEPFSNWFLSLLEDGIAFFLVWLTATHPLIALVLVLALAAGAIYLISRLWRFARRVFSRRAA